MDGPVVSAFCLACGLAKCRALPLSRALFLYSLIHPSARSVTPSFLEFQPKQLAIQENTCDSHPADYKLSNTADFSTRRLRTTLMSRGEGAKVGSFGLPMRTRDAGSQRRQQNCDAAHLTPQWVRLLRPHSVDSLQSVPGRFHGGS
jgi:hypothetical protein